MALISTLFPVEIWLKICQQLKAEYVETDARDARGIVSALSSLSRSCMDLHQILQPVLYEAPALVGTRSLELFFRTIVERDDRASMVQTVRWYEGEEEELYQLHEAEDNEDCFNFGEDFSSKYLAKLRSLDMDLLYFIMSVRGSIEYMHEYAQLLPLFLASLQGLDYRYSPRPHGFNLLSIYAYRSQQPLAGLRDIRIRAAPGDDFNLRSLAMLIRLCRDTLESLHLEWPVAVIDFGVWPSPLPEFRKLRKLCVRDGCLGAESFTELLFHTPLLEEFVYCSAREFVDEKGEEFLAWEGVVQALSQVKDTLRVLDLDLHTEDLEEYHGPRGKRPAVGFREFGGLNAVVLGQDTIFRDGNEHMDGQLLVSILPRALKHFKLRHFRRDFFQHILIFAEGARGGSFPVLETVQLSIGWPRKVDDDERDNHKESEGGLNPEDKRVISNAFEGIGIRLGFE